MVLHHLERQKKDIPRGVGRKDLGGPESRARTDGWKDIVVVVVAAAVAAVVVAVAVFGDFGIVIEVDHHRRCRRYDYCERDRGGESFVRRGRPLAP